MSYIAPSRIMHLTTPYELDVEVALSLMVPKGQNIDALKLFLASVRDRPLTNTIGQLRGDILSSNGEYERTREIVIDRVYARCGCEYEWAVHIASYQRKTELTDSQVYAAVHGNENSECRDAKDSVLIEMVDEFHDTRKLSDNGFAKLSPHFAGNQIIQLFALTMLYDAISSMANGMSLELEDWAPRFPAQEA